MLSAFLWLIRRSTWLRRPSDSRTWQTTTQACERLPECFAPAESVAFSILASQRVSSASSTASTSGAYCRKSGLGYQASRVHTPIFLPLSNDFLSRKKCWIECGVRGFERPPGLHILLESPAFTVERSRPVVYAAALRSRLSDAISSPLASPTTK